LLGTGRRGAEYCPLLHQAPTFLEHVAAPVSSLHLAADDQGRFNNLILERRALARPRLERRAEAVTSLRPISSQQHQESHVGKRAAGLAARSTC
jgi:hypothetical protein